MAWHKCLPISVRDIRGDSSSSACGPGSDMFPRHVIQRRALRYILEHICRAMQFLTAFCGDWHSVVGRSLAAMHVSAIGLAVGIAHSPWSPSGPQERRRSCYLACTCKFRRDCLFFTCHDRSAGTHPSPLQDLTLHALRRSQHLNQSSHTFSPASL